ncbi:MAG: ZIP family metal transporter [Chitinispirillaceae bacterium]|nr:ZIP family metal transporter [Chitinispirillaceae bacterium]
MILFFIIIFSLLGSVVSVLLAAGLLFLPAGVRQRLLPLLISYAAGTLLGAAFLGMLPKALKTGAAPEWIMPSVLGGIILFFVLEKLVLWRHCHKPECEVHSAAGPLILIGDAFHNLIDGVVIAGAFLVSIPAGIAVSIAVIAHEVPQEIGDFALLIEYGYSRTKAFLLNSASSMSTLAGAILAFYALNFVREAIPYVLAVSASSFIYIALADILPGLNRKFSRSGSVLQLSLLLAGIATIAIVKDLNQ